MIWYISHSWLFVFYMKDLWFVSFFMKRFCKYFEKLLNAHFVVVVVVYWSDALYRLGGVGPVCSFGTSAKIILPFFIRVRFLLSVLVSRSSPTERTQMTNGCRSTARHLHPHPPPRADAFALASTSTLTLRWSMERRAWSVLLVDSIQFFVWILCRCRCGPSITIICPFVAPLVRLARRVLLVLFTLFLCCAHTFRKHRQNQPASQPANSPRKL